MTDNNWKLVDAFFDKYDLVDHHIKSYNDFVNNRIQNIIDITEPITLDDGKYTLKTGKVRIEKPSNKEADGSHSEIDPTEARLRNLNYSAHMYLEMALNEDGEENELAVVRIKVNSYHSKYIRALPLHSSQKEIEQTNDYSIFEYHLIPTIDFKQELLSMGSNVEVLTPQNLREEMREEILEMGELYK